MPCSFRVHKYSLFMTATSIDWPEHRVLSPIGIATLALWTHSGTDVEWSHTPVMAPFGAYWQSATVLLNHKCKWFVLGI